MRYGGHVEKGDDVMCSTICCACHVTSPFLFKVQNEVNYLTVFTVLFHLLRRGITVTEGKDDIYTVINQDETAVWMGR